jgi:hypothetical protein
LEVETWVGIEDTNETQKCQGERKPLLGSLPSLRGGKLCGNEGTVGAKERFFSTFLGPKTWLGGGFLRFSPKTAQIVQIDA